MPDVLDGRTVSELGNKRIDSPTGVSIEVGRVENRTEKLVRAKREREAFGIQCCAQPQIGEHLWPDFCARMATIKTGKEGQ